MNPRTERAIAEYEGKEFTCTDGITKFVVTKFNSAADIEILFPESGVRMHKSMYQIKSGIINPFEKSCIYFQDPLKAMLNCYFKTNQGYMIKIIQADSMKCLTYQFQDQHGYIGCTTIQNIRKGQVRNPYHPNEFGGYLGKGPYTGNTYLYNIWHNILVRAVGARDKYEYYTNTQKYENVKICDEWRNFNVFADWYIKNIEKLNSNYQYKIDKDLLYPMYRSSTENYKLYSPVTCVLLPHDLNLSLVDADRFKHTGNSAVYIKQLTEKYKAEGALSDKAYRALKSLYYNDGTPISYINFRGGINYYDGAFNKYDL